MKIITNTNLTCPMCQFVQTLEMPIESCQTSHKCTNCEAILKPKEGDCCVFCSYGDTPCLPKQKDIAERMKHGI